MHCIAFFTRANLFGITVEYILSLVQSVDLFFFVLNDIWIDIKQNKPLETFRILFFYNFGSFFWFILLLNRLLLFCSDTCFVFQYLLFYCSESKLEDAQRRNTINSNIRFKSKGNQNLVYTRTEFLHKNNKIKILAVLELVIILVLILLGLLPVRKIGLPMGAKNKTDNDLNTIRY